MSFLSDLFSGQWSNLGQDLAPSNIFSDFGTDLTKTLENPVADLGIGLGVLTGGLALAPTLGLDLGLGAGTAAAGDLSTLGGVGAAGLGAGVDPTASLLATTGATDVTAGAGTALGFASDTGAGVGTAGLPAEITTGASAATQPLSLTSGLTGNVLPGAGFTGVTGTPDLTSGAADLGDWLNTTNFGTTLGGGTPAAPSDATAALTTPEFTTPTPANPLTGAGTYGIQPAAATGAGAGTTNTWLPSWATTGLNTLKAAAPVAGLAGLGYNLYQGYEQNQQLKALQQQEQQLATTAEQTQQQEQAAATPLLNMGQQLQEAFATNTLPQAYQSVVQQWLDGANASTVQGYAARGQNTDPQQNSALARDLQNNAQQANTLTTQLLSLVQQAGASMTNQANSLLQSGVSATQLAAQIPIQMQNLITSLNTQIANAVSSFAGSLGSGGQKLTLNLAGTNPTTIPLG